MAISPPGPDTLVYLPADLAREVRIHLEAGFPRVWLSGEISNLSKPASGHWYFTLKDDRAQIRCALFRGQRGNVEGQPATGDQVLVRGRISLYEARGDFQLIADAMLPAGAGELQQAFEALKRKLESEGLFDPERKRPLPPYPTEIAVVTSATGAAVRDILATLRRRWPSARVALYPTQVQGEQAVPALLAALDEVQRDARADVMLLARGGGSLEDLWAFNDEKLARRIADMSMPVISGVGHETDFTIADFVADLRAATPTAAAEAATPDGPALRQRIEALSQRLARAGQRTLQQHWQRLDGLDRRLSGQHPERRLIDARARLDQITRRLRRGTAAQLQRHDRRVRESSRRLLRASPARRLGELVQREQTARRRLIQAMRQTTERGQAGLATLARALDAVSPLAVLARGYAVIQDEHGHVLSRADDFHPGQTLHTRVRDLRIESEVRSIESLPPADA